MVLQHSVLALNTTLVLVSVFTPTPLLCVYIFIITTKTHHREPLTYPVERSSGALDRSTYWCVAGRSHRTDIPDGADSEAPLPPHDDVKGAENPSHDHGEYITNGDTKHPEKKPDTAV